MTGGEGAAQRRPLTLAEVELGSENERLGVARDSMLCNPLIVKAELGKPQRNCYTLPGIDFAYGLYIERTDGGVPEAIGHWNTIKPRTHLVQEMPRDYIAMNRGALKAGYTTAREYNLYYKAKDIRRKDGENSLFNKCPPELPADMTYGIKTRSCTPFFDVLHHRYQQLWMEQQRALTTAERVEKKKKEKVRETRTTLLRKNPLPPKEESFWHLPSLEKVKPHLSTLPDRKARQKAFSATGTWAPEQPHSTVLGITALGPCDSHRQ